MNDTSLSTMSLQDKFPLLEHGMYVLPDDISHTTFSDLVVALHLMRKYVGADKPLKLYISGRGGDSDSAMAIVDLLSYYKPVQGVLFGGAISAHGVVWAGCSQRCVTKTAYLGIHQAAFPSGGFATAADIVASTFELTYTNTKIADLFASISKDGYNSRYWSNMMESVATSFILIPSDDLVYKYGMSEPFERL